MALYFIYRTPYNTLVSKFTKRIEANSILEWFQQIWRLDLNGADLTQFFIETFGMEVYGIVDIGYPIVGRQIQQPESFDELIKIIKENAYINSLKTENEKYLEVETDDDDFDLAWYLIEEEYAKKNLNRFSYLIYEDWKLPINFSEGGKKKLDYDFKEIINPVEKKEGELYFISICQDDADGPIQEKPIKISGIRLTDLKDYLINEKFSYEELPKELILYLVKLKEQEKLTNELLISDLESFQDAILLFHQLFQSYKIIEKDKLNLGYEASKQEFEKKFNILREKISYLDEMKEFYIRGNEHFIQMTIQATFFGVPIDLENMEIKKQYDQIFIFDDLWVNENYELANSLVNYYTSWSL